MNPIEIALDGRLYSELAWGEALQVARNAVEQGNTLFWMIDLGLFSSLPLPVANETQYLSLGLSLDHFRDVVWTEFGPHSSGVCFYRGSPDFVDQLCWDREQEERFQQWLQEGSEWYRDERKLRSLYCRDVAAEYFSLLSSHLSAEIPLFLHFDVRHIASPLMQAQLTTQESFSHFKVVISGCSWHSEERRERVGICLPSVTMHRLSCYEGLEEAMHDFLARGIPFRIIPESLLSSEWDGLDEIIVAPSGLTPQGRRQLQGFIAAGGKVTELPG